MPRAAIQRQEGEDGEGRSLPALFERYGRDVYRAAYRVCGDEATAEDALQTVFLRLHEKGHVERLTGDPGPYLRRAGVNAALDELRRRKGLFQLDEPTARRLRDEDAGPDRRLDSRELRSRLRGALSRLSSRAAEVFVLREIEGLTNRQIATLLDTSANSVAVTLHRAKRGLREALRTDHPADGATS